jgi:hypothetical protein
VNIDSADQKRPIPACCAKPTVKKPYVKPMVRHERVFETMALTCGKVQVTQSGCGHNRKIS